MEQIRLNRQEVIDLISRQVNELRQQNDLAPVVVEYHSQLLGGPLGIDSLDLAALVVHLEEATGRDPFSEGIVNFRTAGELAALYADQEG